MNEPNKGWRESDAGKFFEKHKVPILVGAAIVLALSWWISKVPEPALQKSTRALFAALQARWQGANGSAGIRDPG